MGADVQSCVARYLRPEPRVRLGVMLSRTRAAAACMDLSDGLADAAQQMAEASHVGMTIDAASLPVNVAARTFFDARGVDAITEAITAGDDYELLLAVRPRAHRRLTAASRHGGVALTRVGRCTENPAVVLHRIVGDGAADTAPLPKGFSHFR